MANIDFGANLGTTVAFNPATDTLIFGTTPYSTYYNASRISFEQVGADLVVSIADTWSVTLASTAFGSLTSADFSFTGGGVVQLDTAGNDTLTGTANDDYFDIRKGGSDTVNAGAGSNWIYAGSALSSGDVITGGADYDVLELSGNYASAVTLGATTVTGVEMFVAGAGSTIRLVLDAATLSSMSTPFGIIASEQLAGDLLYVDGSAAAQQFDLVGGAGDDTLIGGAGENYLDGGAGADYIVGGDGYNTVYAGAGDDTVVGGNDQDYIIGQGGNDTISGGAGDDTLMGFDGDDQISGGNGEDSIFGDTGDDILVGGAGADVFVFGYVVAQGADQINDFNVSEDTIWLQSLGTFSAVSESGGNTILTYDYGTVQINGVTGLTLSQWNGLLDYRFEYAPPTITSDGGGDTGEIGILEGETAVTTVTSYDPNPGETGWYTIVGGDDAALFGIDNWTGELVFLAAPDFETPADADSDNVYEVTVQVDDGVYADTQALSITVEDVAERSGHHAAARHGWAHGHETHGMGHPGFHEAHFSHSMAHVTADLLL